ncbi:membrane fusion protein, multidrug efflux system [Chryseobacterium carnipullorum]|uniref:efflux RND transporter periplasmic adaptor subunit n=1 Tax=Chryseobacterium carnipullorum TaxID=1124835 RepID=UPI0009106FA6|nr:efflux RND transporter periplasmic adaptor subunit [Chryseobacterium carnipullorum]SHL76754.1 membrane fusion protein, multidrug efflux system [Chryseobacterium carnipullorum]
MNNKLVILSIAAFSLTACKKEAPKQDGAKPYPVINVEAKSIVGYQTFPATIQGRVNNDVRAKIQGYITQVLVDEGQYVTKGQPLFRLETNILTENAAAAKAGIGAAESTIAASQAAVNAAQVEVNKLKPLVAKNIISDVQLQTAQANLSQAKAQLQQSIAAKQQASANYKGVAANIEYSIIRAPISGVIGKLPLKVGSLVGPTDQTALTTISDTSELFAYFSMNEKEYFDFLEKSPGATMSEKIKNLPMVELQLANGSIYSEKGRIEAITGQIDVTTGTIQFRVAFTNPQKLLSNGNSGSIRLPKTYDNVLVIPESATYEQQGIVYAYKVDKGDTARNVVINVIDRIDNMALIKSGVNKGEMIVAAGIGGLKPGTAVKPKPVKMDSLVQSIKPKF